MTEKQPIEERWRIGEEYTLVESIGVQGVLGKGGFATVRAFADQKNNGKLVAIKRRNAPTETITPEEISARFRNESEILKQLAHPNIVTMREYWTDEIALEFLSGWTLVEYVGNTAIALDDALFVVRGLLQAVWYMHAIEVVHRDLSPHNVFLHFPLNLKNGYTTEAKAAGPREESQNFRLDAVVKVIDFGISSYRGTSHTSTKGNRFKSGKWGAPEEVPTRAGDIYQIGILAVFMLTGLSPKSDGPCPGEWNQLLGESPLPDPIKLVLQKAISRASVSRFESASHFRDALENAVHAVRVSLRVHRESREEKSPYRLLAATVLGCVLGILTPRLLEPHYGIKECPAVRDPTAIKSWESARNHMANKDPNAALREIDSIIEQRYWRDEEIRRCPEFLKFRAQVRWKIAHDMIDACDEGGDCGAVVKEIDKAIKDVKDAGDLHDDVGTKLLDEMTKGRERASEQISARQRRQQPGGGPLHADPNGGQIPLGASPGTSATKSKSTTKSQPPEVKGSKDATSKKGPMPEPSGVD